MFPEREKRQEASPFPIDAVYTWVDSGDPRWLGWKQALFAELFPGQRMEPEADDARFRSNDELRYALRSLALYAPWVRKVHVVTANQCPAWLNTDIVNLVSHETIFPPDAPLPVFNSHAIEFCLHRIPGLAEQFLSCNDDFMFGRAVRPEDFFLPDGRPKVWAAKRSSRHVTRLFATLSADPHGAAFKTAYWLIHEAFDGYYLPYTVRHFPRAMRRSSAYSLWQVFPAEIRGTVNSPLRSATDVFPAMLYALYLLAVGQGNLRLINGLSQVRDFFCGGLAHVGASLGDSNMRRKMTCIRLLRPRTFCLNDSPGASPEDIRAMRAFLENYFPGPSRFELTG